jgi:hypothetical protein
LGGPVSFPFPSTNFGGDTAEFFESIDTSTRSK